MKTTDKTNIPWSVKGVSKEARDVAKNAAASQGLTIGGWLTEAIHGTMEEVANKPIEIKFSERLAENRNTDSSPDYDSDTQHTLKNIVENIAETEEQILNLLHPLQDVINQLSLRIEILEE